MSTTPGAAPTQPAANPPTPAGVPEAEVQQREATARADGAKAERTRIGAILNHEAAAQRPGLAKKLAFDTDMTAESAVAVLGAAGVETAAAAPDKSPLAAAMASVPNPDVGPDATKAGAAADDADAATTAKNVVALFNQAKGGK